MSALHIDVRRRGKVDDDQLGRGGLSLHPLLNCVPHVIHIEINQSRLRSKNQNTGNELVTGMPLTVGETTSARDTPKEGDMGLGGATDEVQVRDNCADHPPPEQPGTQPPEKSRRRHDEFGSVSSPKQFKSGELK